MRGISVSILLVIALSVPTAWAKGPLSSSQIYRKCSERSPRQVAKFEASNQMGFELAIKQELAAKKAGVHSEDVNSFCASLFGAKYGKIQFSSDPSNAPIKVDSEAQNEKTNITLNFKVGKYSYSIEPPQKKPCNGTVEVKKNQTTKLHCIGG